MLQLYDKNHIKIEGLKKYKDYCVESNLSNGDKKLSFLYHSEWAANIVEEGYIKTKKDEFVIKEISDTGDYKNITAVMNVESLEGKSWDRFECLEQSVSDCINLSLAGTGWSLGNCNVSKRRTVRKTNCSSWDIIQEIKKVYRVELEFDTINKKINVYEKMGSDKGTYFVESLNLKALSTQSNSYDFYTKLIAKGKDDLSITVENYQYSNKVKELIWKDERYTDLNSLTEDATAKLAELSEPYRSYSADIIDLANISEEYKNILSYTLGDTITLISKEKGIKEKQRIVKIVEYPEEPERNSCEIANTVLKFEDVQKEQNEINDTVSNITADDGTISEDAIRGPVERIVINKADIGELSAAVARIGNLETTKANITDLTAINANITNLQATKANIIDLEATNAKLTNIEGKTANIETVLAKDIFVELATAGKIVAGSSFIANGAIGDAQISSLSAAKINAGTVDTTKVTIAGANSRLKITGNRLQVFATKADASLYERVSLGDVNGDGTIYGIRVRGADGTTILLDETGVKREGITDGSINNAKISGDANIDGSKLNIATVVTSINNGTTTIQGSKVYVDGKTLDLSFSTLKDTVTTQGNTISTQAASITALDNKINLKVDTQTYTAKVNAIDSNISTITTNLNKATSDISILQGQISLKVEQTDITNAINSIQIGGRNLFKDTLNYNWSNTALWNYYNGTVVDGGTYNGFKVARITTQWGRRVQTVPCEPNTEYVVSAWIKGGNATTCVQGFCNDSSVISYAWSSSTPVGISWKRFYFVIKTGLTQTTMSPRIEPILSTGNDLYICAYKVEKGNKATDWSPAQEDISTEIDTKITTAKAEIIVTTDSITSSVSSVQSTVNGLGTRLTTAESSITSLNNSIALKVSATDFNSYKTTNDNAVNSKASQTDLNTTNSNLTTLTTRVSTAESSITVLQGQIVSKVSQTDIDDSVAVQSFGNDQKIFNNVLGISSNPVTGALVIETPITCNNYMTRVDISGYTYLGSTADIDCSISFYVYNTKTFYNYAYTSKGNFDVSRVRLALNTSNKVVIIINDVTTNWQYPKIYINKVSIAFSTAPDNFKTGWTSAFKTDVTTGYTQITEVATKKITESTSGSQAKVDNLNSNIVQPLVTRVSVAETSITQMSNSIALKVSTSDYNTKMSSLDGSISSLTTRMNTAESKITDTAIINTVSATINNAKNEAVNSANANTANSLTGYYTKSEVNQSINNVTFKFSSNGGNNLIRNGRAKKGMEHWGIWEYSLVGSNLSRVINSRTDMWTNYESAINIQINSMTSGEYGCIQWFPTVIGKKYVFTCYLAGHRSTKSIVVRGTSSSDYGWLTYENFGEITGGDRLEWWTKVVIPFTAQRTSTGIQLCITSTIGTDGYLWAKDIMVSEGDDWKPYSAHPSEIYDGNTVIDYTGVTINNGALKVVNANGQTTIDGSQLLHRIVSYGNGSLVIPNGQVGANVDIWHNMNYYMDFMVEWRSTDGRVWSDPYVEYDWATMVPTLVCRAQMWGDRLTLHAQRRAGSTSGSLTLYYRYFILDGTRF